MVTLGWRDVPTDNSHIGPTPRKCEPKIRQIFVGMGRCLLQPAGFRPPALSGPPAGGEHHRVQRSSGDRPEARFTSAPQRFAHHLQGDADGPPGPPILPRPEPSRILNRPWRSSIRDSAPTRSHPGTGPSVPLPGPQRRDQHAARQPQLDARPLRLAAIAKSSATNCRKCSRSSPNPAPTPPRSTTPCSSSRSTAGASPTAC